MAENLRSDGKAVDVVLTKAVKKGDLIKAEGWVGIAMRDGEKNETIAIETTQREFVININDLTGAKGDVIYMTPAGELTNTKAGNDPVIKVTRAKDSNNNVWAKLLPQLY